MTTPNKTPRCFIGLDAGRETGLAFWNAERQMFAREHCDEKAHAREKPPHPRC